MQHTYTISKKRKELEDTYVYQLVPQGKHDIISFLPGQFVTMTNPTYKQPNEQHPFSIASSPSDPYLEFCIRVYGNWTQAFSTLEPGDTVSVSDPKGEFTWTNHSPSAVFLLGGIGISPIMSMLRFIRDKKIKTEELVLLYGNRNPQSVAYKAELEILQKELPLRVSYVFSDTPTDDTWDGYKGFITRDIVEKEVNLSQKPTFFFIGPPIFEEKMQVLMKELGVPSDQIMQEKL